MNRQEIEAALEADWESVVSFFHNLFHKASNPEVTPPSAVPEVAPPQVIADPVVPVVVVPPAEAPAVVAPDNPFVAWKAQNLSIYDIIAPAMLARSLTPAELEQAKAAGYDVSDFAPGATLTLDGFDPHKTNLDPSDFGKVFKAEPGTTTYTVNVPNGARAFLLRDGEFQADQMATFAIDGNPPEKCIFTGPIAQLSVGTHTVTVACNYEMSFQIQP